MDWCNDVNSSLLGFAESFSPFDFTCLGKCGTQSLRRGEMRHTYMEVYQTRDRLQSLTRKQTSEHRAFIAV